MTAAVSTLVPLVGMTVTGAPGTGDITLNAAIAGFLTAAQGGATDGITVTYEAIDAGGTVRDLGRAVYTAAGTTLSGRTCIKSTNGNANVSLTANALIFLSVATDDLVSRNGGLLLGALDWAAAVTVASATTPAIGAAASNLITMSGTTTVTGFDTVAAGVSRWIKHTGAHVLTQNATSLILIGGANITTVAGDISFFVSEGSGNWRQYLFVRASSLPALLAGGNTFTGLQSIPAAKSLQTDKGNSGTSTQTYDVSAASQQKSTVTGAHTIAFSNWPASGTYGEVEIQLVNGGSAAITWPTINWVIGDGTTSTTFPSTVTLASSGTNFAIIWSSDGGTTLYGKIA